MHKKGKSEGARLESAREHEHVYDEGSVKLPAETPATLAAIDEGLRSLETEPTLSAEDVRRNIRAWVAR